MNWRNNLANNRTPIQQSLTVERRDYIGVERVDRLMQGVVIDVFPSDNEDGNRSAWQVADRHGFYHECSVLVLNDGGSTYMVLPHVIIPPSHPSGIDDYSERLPRPSTCLTTGEALSSGLAQVDPYDLDGDMCVVGFIGGMLDQPFIVSWWPHPRNMFDPATSGPGFPDSEGVGKALEQHRRYFRRINGVETTITREGDIIISTSLAGSQINVQGEPENGRFARSNVDEGGSVRVYMKPDSTMEWLWDTQIDGVGTLDNPEPALPQSNPPPDNAGTPDTNKISTYLLVDESSFSLQTPANTAVQAGGKIQLTSSDNVEISADKDFLVDIGGRGDIDFTDTLDLVAGNFMTIESPTAILVHSGDPVGPLATSAKIGVVSDVDLDILATGPVGLVSVSSSVTLVGGTSVVLGVGSDGIPDLGVGTITVASTGISLGNGASEALVLGTSLDFSWQTILGTIAALPPAVGTDKAVINDLVLSIIDLIDALNASLSTSTKTV